MALGYLGIDHLGISYLGISYLRPSASAGASVAPVLAGQWQVQTASTTQLGSTATPASAPGQGLTLIPSAAGTVAIAPAAALSSGLASVPGITTVIAVLPSAALGLAFAGPVTQASSPNVAHPTYVVLADDGITTVVLANDGRTTVMVVS